MADQGAGKGMDATKNPGGAGGGSGWDATTQARPPGMPNGASFTVPQTKPMGTPQTVNPATVPAGGGMNTPGTPNGGKPFSLGS